MKAVIGIGYRDYVMEAEDALALLQVMAKMERYETKWRKEEEGGTRYFIWAASEGEQPGGHGQNAGSLRLISDDHYRLAKLAGAPPKD
jgi:hypothetical protein